MLTVTLGGNPVQQSNPSSWYTIPHRHLHPDYHHRKSTSAFPLVSPTLLFAFSLWLAMQETCYASVSRKGRCALGVFGSKNSVSVFR